MATSRKLSFNLPERVAGALTSVVPPGSLIVVGLSGGVDSVVLLHLLKQLAPQFSWRLTALHVHHGISRHADEWAQFCADLCKRYEIPCIIEHVDITPLRAMGIEAAARQLRHAALARQQADFIMLAHHRDDQVETLLLQLLRGAGVRGASAMPLLKKVAGSPPLVRPLLKIERSELEIYAEEHGLSWVEDDSNTDTRYPRNFLRHEILPRLEQHFPAYRATLARSAAHFAEAAMLQDELAMHDALRAIAGDQLNLSTLRNLNLPRAKNLLRYFLQQRGASLPESTRLEEMLRQLLEARNDAHIEFAWDQWQLRSFRAQAYVLPQLQEPQAFQLVWNGENTVALPGSHGVLHFSKVQGQGLSLQKLKQDSLVISPKHGGESIKLDARRPRQTVRNLLQQKHIPPWQRELMPMLYSGGELVCVPGVAYAGNYLPAQEEAGVLVTWNAQG